MGWLRITKWKVAAIVLIVAIAVLVDGWAWISRVTVSRTSTVCAPGLSGCPQKDMAPTRTTFDVAPGDGRTFAPGIGITVGGRSGVVKSVKGDQITLAAALASPPGEGVPVSQFQGLAGLAYPLSSTPSILGLPIYVHKGLDIVGGSELTIAICQGYNNPPAAHPTCRNGPRYGTVSAAQQETIPVLQNRVNSLGVSEATVTPLNTNEVVVQLPGVALSKAESVVGTTAQLHFATAVTGSAPTAAASDKNYCGTHPKDKFCIDQQNLFDTTQIGNPSFYQSGYHWKIDTNLPATDIVNAQAATATSSSGASLGPAVDITFSTSGGDEWHKITDAAYSVFAGCSSDPATCPPTAQIAIFLDNTIISAPQVVSNGQTTNTQITGLTQAEATTLAQQINAGSLPAEIGTVAATSVGATLGQQTVNATLLAGAVGMIIVILFMMSYYRFPGILASVALILYSILNLAAYKLIGVTVSLAGLAGFVLSVGMAVDANVLIFERTRDELRHGRPVSSAVEIGFRRAFPAIRDSNISTGIVCVILAYFGSDVIKGFAITLGIGVLISFFSAIMITQSLLTWVMRWHVGRNPTLYTQIHEEYATSPPRGRFDIVRNRNWFFALSLLIIIPGLIAILAWHDVTSPAGFRLGIDFAGGNQIQAVYATHPTTTQLIDAVNRVQPGLQPQVQPLSGGYYSIQTLPTGQSTAIAAALASQFHEVPGTESLSVVGPSIAGAAVSQAIYLILIASAAIALYLAYQFGQQKQVNRWRFAACTFFKLLHDVFVLLGIWAIIGHFTPLGTVNSYFVTAVLTGVAFSIHDTIVVFDRIRENIKIGPRFTFDQIVNLSTVQTMTRSLNTSLTVVFVLLALVLFGGASIQGFVLALLVGIVTGTYSSIFNASTLLVAWEKARPQQLMRGLRPRARPVTAGAGQV